MSKWNKVGSWLKENGEAGVNIIGSLLTGNVTGAIAQGVSLVSGATGYNDPDKVLEQLQGNPESIVKLKELYFQNEHSIRAHVAKIAEIEAQDEAKEHHETQDTIRAGDRAQDRFVRWTRPGQSWASLGAAFGYVFTSASINITVLGLLLALPMAYAGLRQTGKLMDAWVTKEPQK